MPISLELAQEIEKARCAQSHARALKRLCEASRQQREADKATLDARYPRTRTFNLLAIAESLVTAHKAALSDGDGTTIDVVQDALVHVGIRLARETHATGPAARTIIGYHRQEPESGDDRDGAIPERR